ncbi:MAG: hypothetical protein OEO79_15280 [Gemmatimonadota bacterium]|nr:hypothetical protein [Gemmatimonadota bacterium]
MGNEARPLDNRLLLRWAGANTLGWLLGFVLVVVLAEAWEFIGGGAQFMVGVGMGAGVGVVQSRVIAPWVTSARQWLLASTIGMGTPFLLWDVGTALGMSWPLSLWACVLSGAVLVGVLQQRLFRPSRPRVRWWVAACAVGWAVPEGLIVLDDLGLLPGGWQFLTIAGVVFGGVLLGAVTGAALPWMLPDPAV